LTIKTLKHILLLVLLLFAGTARATHIVGGEIYYELLNSNSNLYKITLRLYIDCQNGNPQAIASDAIALIGVYNAGNNSFIQQFSMNASSPKRVNEVNYNCVKPPTGICVDEYTYTINKVINPGSNGVFLAFQRCCRNNSITNLVQPENTGITIWTMIAPGSTTNSSAVFKKLPPNYVCMDAPLTVDHSATDADGDSLVYVLSTPYAGGTPDDPRPEPSSATRPPFDLVIWKNPYKVNNQMGGDPILSINPTTGELTVTPKTKGQFVIGITVYEYRNGVLIGETRRDYQFNVIDCVFDILADFTTQNAVPTGEAYVFECADTVFFKDRSQKATDYHWDFGDPNTLADTSNLKNPWYVYPGNGDYKVTLTVKNNLCQDEYSFLIRIRSKKTFELGPDVILCRGFNTLLDTKTPDATRVLWNTGQLGERIVTQDTGLFIATVSYDKCVYSDSVRVRSEEIKFSIPADTLFCDSVDMTMDIGVPNLRYAWSTGSKDTFQTLRVFQPGTYIAAVRNNYCIEFDTIRIWTTTKPDIKDGFFCGTFSRIVDVGNIEEAQYLWSNGATTRNTVITTGGKHWIRIKQRNCVFTDSFEIINPLINLNLGDNTHFCDSFIQTLDAGNDGIVFKWNTGDTTRSITVNTPGTYSVLVTDENGCKQSDSIVLSLSNSPTINIGNDTSICLASPTTITAPKGFEKYEWNIGATNQSIVIYTEGWYGVVVTDNYGCNGTDSLYVTVDEDALPNELFIPNAFTPNNNGFNERFPFSENILQPGYYIIIYNRWGQKVFDSREQELQNWDGTYKGKTVPQETYIYYLYYRGCDGHARSKKGTVNPLY
jgi:gliding motility-associated-like protein